MDSKHLFWADLHCHTSVSDGELSPAQLLEMAKTKGLKGLSITDHDTIGAYPKATTMAKDLGLHLGAGIELSCDFAGHNIHILGYDFDLNSIAIQMLCQRHQIRRRHRNEEILKRLQKEGFEISFKEIEDRGEGNIVGRPHIAQLMMEKGYVSSVKEAFKQYLGEGKCCYVHEGNISVDETIEIIHAAFGKAFIAHPHLLSKSFSIEELLKRPFDGIESAYGNFSQLRSDKWVKIAQHKGWLMSGGSDFHGSIKPELSLGCCGVGEETFFQIFEKPLL